jgi:hypothetical protein
MKTTRTIAGHAFTLTPGRRCRAERPMADGREAFTVSIKDLGSGDTEAEVGGLAYDAANDLLAKFNDGASSWDGRVW